MDDEVQSENLRIKKASNKQKMEGTAFAVLMENSAQVFGNTENKVKKRLFNDVTNCRNNKCQKRNVQKSNRLQTSITNYAVIKHRPSNFGNLRKTIEEENAKKLETTAWTDNSSSSSHRSTSKMDIEDEIIDDSSHFICNDSEIDMDELQTRFNQALGKRFSGSEPDICEDKQEPMIKRRKEDEKRRLKSEAENSKKEQNEAERGDSDDYFCESKYSLVIVQKPNILTAGFACIENVVLKNLLESMHYQEFIKKYVLIDCRYPYEYEGGHIKGALNIYDPVVLEHTFFPKCQATFETMIKRIPIFYCEYSSARGPVLASHLRKSDRVRNYDKYPFLHYNEIYVLQGGYNSFYNTDNNCFKELCEPKGYISMQDKNYSHAFKIYHTRSIRHGVGFETGMFQTAVIRKNADFRRTHSVPQFPESPTAFQFSSVGSSEKHHQEISTISMLANPRTPTGRKKNRLNSDQ